MCFFVIMRFLVHYILIKSRGCLVIKVTNFEENLLQSGQSNAIGLNSDL